MQKALFIIFLIFPILLSATKVTLSADKGKVAAGEQIVLQMEVLDDSDDDVGKVEPPSFDNFNVMEGGTSSSSSVNIINGKMTKKDVKTYTYELTPTKEGTFVIGPAKVYTESGKSIKSNTLTIIVSGSLNNLPGATMNSNTSDDSANENIDRFSAPLTEWEKRTKNYFLRIVPENKGDLYEGEPFVAGWYLYLNRSISNLSFVEQPHFQNSWSETLQSPNSLTNTPVFIDGVGYRQSLLKRYLLLPQPGASSIEGTQLILKVAVGSGFGFSTKTFNISSPKLDIKLLPLPDKANHPDATYGAYELFQDKTTLNLSKDKLFDTVTYTVSGCGNFNAVELELSEINGLKIFDPEKKTTANVSNGEYCGKKEFKFMIKALQEGKYEIPSLKKEFFNKKDGYYTIQSKPVKISATVSTALDDNNEKVSAKPFEIIRTLSSNLKTYSTLPMTETIWFMLMLVIPLVILILTFMIWLTINSINKKKAYASKYRSTWERKFAEAENPSDLLNLFYDSFLNCYNISFKGEKINDLKKKYGKNIENTIAFTTKIQHAIYSGNQEQNLNELKKEAITLLRNRGGLK